MMSPEFVLVTVLFWTGLGGLLYGYVLFPALVALVPARTRKISAGRDQAGATGPVTIIVSAHNEQATIEAKIRNVLTADYPRHLLDVVVVSDGSTDRTEDITRGFSHEGVRLLVQQKREGKTAGLNRAIQLARGEIVVFTDANAIYPPAAVRALVRYFQNPKIGLVTGYTKYLSADSGPIAKATNAHTTLERAIKMAESKWGFCVGADGAIFAMRRSLYRTLRNDDINDFALPLGVIDQGYECVFAEEAFCFENPGANLDTQFRRQSRITNRTLRALWRNAHLLSPFRFPLFAFFLFSHKIVRLLAPIFLVQLLGALFFLAPTGGIYRVAAVSAVFGVVLSICCNLSHFLRIFLTVNIAVLHGWWKFLSGQTDVIWQPDRSAS